MSTPRMDKIVLEPIGILSTASKLYVEGCKLEEELTIALQQIKVLRDALGNSDCHCTSDFECQKCKALTWKTVTQHAAESAAKDLLKYER